jgi:hypothetical protein
VTSRRAETAPWTESTRAIWENKDGRAWRIGGEAEVACSASPLEDPDRHSAGVLAVLSEHSAGQPWWIGYLDTGGADIVFDNVRKVRPGPNSEGGTC